MEGIMAQKYNNVKGFWSTLDDAVVASGIQKSAEEWWVRKARKFALSIKGTPLRSRTFENVRDFSSCAVSHKAMHI